MLMDEPHESDEVYGASDFIDSIPLEDTGELCSVAGCIRPLLMEWMWYRDKQTGTVGRRAEDGTFIPLFVEHMRHAVRFPDNTAQPEIPDQYIHTVFGGSPRFRDLLAWTQTQRHLAIQYTRTVTPSAVEILKLTLVEVLQQHFLWQAAPGRWVFTHDTANLTPGTLTFCTTSKKPAYQNLGDWWLGEYPGQWTARTRTPTGIAPLPYRRAIEAKVVQHWEMETDYINDHIVPFRMLWSILRTHGYPVRGAIRIALELVRTHPVL